MRSFCTSRLVKIFVRISFFWVVFVQEVHPKDAREDLFDVEALLEGQAWGQNGNL